MVQRAHNPDLSQLFKVNLKKEISITKQMSTEKKNSWLVPNYPPLTDDVGQAAVNGQVFNYPKVVRTMVDPAITSQGLGLLSFMLFKEPKKFSSGKAVYGYVKLRGNYNDQASCEFEASKIIREIDSKFQVRFAPVGHWVPITDEEAFVKEKIDVKTSEEDHSFRDAAMREKEAEQRKIIREVKERKEELENDGDIYDHPESLKFYSMKRVTELRLMETRDAYMKNIDSIKEKLEITQKELYKLSLANPQYTDEWIDCYNEERKKAGVPNYVPSEEQMEEHDHAQNNLKDTSFDVSKVKLPEVTENTPKNNEPVPKKEFSAGSLEMVMKQGGCGAGFAKLALEKHATVVDAILFVKKSISTVVESAGCHKLVAVGALEMNEGDVDRATEAAKNSN